MSILRKAALRSALTLGSVAICVATLPASADTRCYSAKSRDSQRCLRYDDFERREICIRRAERKLDTCIARAEPLATRPVMDVLPDPQPTREPALQPQPAADQCPPSAGGAPVACSLHVETIVMPHMDPSEDG